MADKEHVQQPSASAAPTRASDRPPERLVRHVFWKYPILSVVLLVLVVVLAAAVGSPNWPRDTIAGATKDNPGGAIMAFTQELDGTATSIDSKKIRFLTKANRYVGVLFACVGIVAAIWHASWIAGLLFLVCGLYCSEIYALVFGGTHEFLQKEAKKESH